MAEFQGNFLSISTLSTHLREPKARGSLAKASGALLLAGVLLISANAQAKDSTGSKKPYTITMHDFIANVEIVTTSGPEATIKIADTKTGKESVLFTMNNRQIEVFSKTAPNGKKFRKKLNNWRQGKQAFRTLMADYPTVKIAVPEGTNIIMKNVATQLDIADVQGDISLQDMIYVAGTVGDIQRGDIQTTGAGELAFGSVAQMLKARVTGSGSLSFVQSGPAWLQVIGSGDITVGSVFGDVNANITGSGDIELGDIAGSCDLLITGSGDIQAGDIAEGLEVNLKGSGDIKVAAIEGPGEITIAGSGDVEIVEGLADPLRVSIRGSGDFDFGGLARNPNVSVNGSGDVFIKAYEGKVKTSGRGGMTIGDLSIDN